MKRFLCFLMLFINIASAQDSLYLVNTLVGDSVNKIISAKGAGDINGDGYADLVVSYTDSVKVFLGNDRFELKPAYAYGNNNGFVLCPGDVNGDGYADLLVGDKRFPTGTHDHISNIHLLFGGETIDTCTTFGYEVNLWDQIFSKQVDPIGDVNGDGYIDFAISSPYNWSNGISYVFLYLGGDSISSEPFVTFEHSPFIDPNSEASFGHAVCGIGDVNNDGYDDILIGDPYYDDSTAIDAGRVYLYYGGVAMDSIADSIFSEDKGGNFGFDIENLGDIDGDELEVFAIAAPGYIYFFEFPNEIFRMYGFLNTGGGGDINNDGYNDFLLGNIQYINENNVMVGGAFLYYGGSEQDTIYDYKLEGETQWSDFSRELDIIGDFNSDGYDDFCILAPLYPDDKNETGKFYLYSYKKVNSIIESKNTVISDFHLFPNYPNPFNPSTTIMYEIPQTSEIQIKIYDIRGRLIRTLVNKKQKGGSHKVLWNGRNAAGRAVASGLYIYRLSSKGKTLSAKMLLLR